MTTSIETRPAWFVGASFGGTDDQLTRFLKDGIWEIHDPYEADSALVKSMKVGDRIAVKAAYVRKKGLPFDNRDQVVSVMSIKAVGTITGNPQDGERVRVDWKAVDPPREWYFSTYQKTIWRVLPGEWIADALIAFAFDGKPQDIDRFRNAPYWRERFGFKTDQERRFSWTSFYEAIGDGLLRFRGDRKSLIAGLKEIAGRVEGLGVLEVDRYTDGRTGFVRDICPFTTMGLFNRRITDSNRKAIAAALARFLNVSVPVPETFEGIPLLNNQKSWYFGYEKDRPAEQIDSLWDVFSAGLTFADAENEESRKQFALAFDGAMGQRGVAWNLTFGLYWARPWFFPSVDQNTRTYLDKKLGIALGRHGPKNRSNAADYLSLMESLEARFQEQSYPVHSYPELSLESWLYKDPELDSDGGDDGGAEEPAQSAAQEPLAAEALPAPVPIVPYSLSDIVSEGCFLEVSEVERLLERLRSKKNLILQGPPGTGKTWLAKRLAFALMGQKDESKVRAVQFHPNLSYEDFVRGWRPSGDGRLTLVDGPFMESVKAASRTTEKVVIVIEEINRGNPAQILGEMLTLLEDSKRNPDDALELSYPDVDGARRKVHIPQNLYVVGTMNIADRSLAMVDMALRRRFAFVELSPKLGNRWREWVVKECGVDAVRAADIERRVTELNLLISSDARLGKQFCIGHSYVTPSKKLETGDTQRWFREVVETEIGPLLEEYWIDALSEATKARDRLLKDW